MSTSREYAFVGTDFDRRPYQSGIGTLIRVSRLNRYASRDLRFAVGLAFHRQDDRSSLMTFSERRKANFAAAIGAPEEVYRQWDLSYWLPFVCKVADLKDGFRFRYCPTCMYGAYHCLLHQLPWIHRCPWHGDSLRSCCRKCGAALRLDGRLDTWLGICRCGYDHVNEFVALRRFDATDQVDALCRIYTRWAARQRSISTLILPHPTQLGWEVLQNAFELPRSLRWRSQVEEPSASVHRVDFIDARRCALGTDDVQASLAKLVGLDSPGSAMIETPRRLAIRVRKVCIRLAGQLPPRSLSKAEMALFLGPSCPALPRAFIPADRHTMLEVSTLPLVEGGSRTYLNLTCLSPVVRQAGGALAKLVDATASPTNPTLRRASNVALGALFELIARGYSEGLRLVIGRHVPDLYSTRRDRPHLSEPWILVRTHGPAIVRAHIYWARLPRNPI